MTAARPPGRKAGPVDMIREQVRLARSIAKTVLVEGIGERDYFEACIDSGVRFLAGPAIVKPCQTIIGQLVMPREKLVSRIAVA